MREPQYTTGTNEHSVAIDITTLLNDDGSIYLQISQEQVPVYNRPAMEMSQEEAESLGSMYSGVEA